MRGLHASAFPAIKKGCKEQAMPPYSFFTCNKGSASYVFGNPLASSFLTGAAKMRARSRGMGSKK
jgi:hypothetical protein